MKKEEIQLWDLKRIFFGDAPPEFLLETFIRTLIIYIGLLFIIRLLGKRMAGQLTITEMAVMLTLGAIVAPAMQMPDRGIIMGLFILGCIAVLQRTVTLINFKNPNSEHLTQGKVTVLVEDGVLNLAEMGKVRISHQQLFATLRESEIFNLGAVDRVYLEACGAFSIYKAEKPRAGLSVMPPNDKDLYNEQRAEKGKKTCANCGYTRNETETSPCKNCGTDEWINAIL
ncbi:MAG: DUF421 domain-containing protein [Flavisolibacter sp.]